MYGVRNRGTYLWATKISQQQLMQFSKCGDFDWIQVISVITENKIFFLTNFSLSQSSNNRSPTSYFIFITHNYQGHSLWVKTRSKKVCASAGLFVTARAPSLLSPNPFPNNVAHKGGRRCERLDLSSSIKCLEHPLLTLLRERTNFGPVLHHILLISWPR